MLSKNDLPNTRDVSLKRIALFSVSILAMSLLPLLYLSFFNRPYADDFSYGSMTVHVVRNTGSLFGVLRAAVDVAVGSYKTWQGTYSATFLFALQPAIFGDKFYFLTTFILLGGLVFSTAYLLFCICLRLMKTDIWTYLLLLTGILYPSIHHIPEASEAFFWFNGGVFYTFFYSLSLVLLGMIISIPNIKSGSRLFGKTVLVTSLSLTIGGGNYMTALLTVLFLMLICFVFEVKKVKNRSVAYVSLIMLLCGLAISAAAPGNAVRAGVLNVIGYQRLSIISTITASFEKSSSYIAIWANPQYFIIMLLLMPLALRAVRITRYFYKYPLIVLAGAYCFFSAQFAPPTFMGIGDSGRHINIFYYLFILLSVLCEVYLAGWISRKVSWLHESGRSQAKQRSVLSTKALSAMSLALLTLLAALTLYSNNHTGILALKTIRQGQARQFAYERDQRLAVFENPAIVYAIVAPLSIKPTLFHQTDLSVDDDWVNWAVAAYYDSAH